MYNITYCSTCKTVTSWHRKDNDALNALQCDKCHTQHSEDAKHRQAAGVQNDVRQKATNTAASESSQA